MSGSSLGPNQRTRLMQSSRKIEAILGVTPQFVELQPSTARPHSFRRDGRMFTHSSNSSMSSFGDSSESLLSLPPSKPKSGLSIKLLSGGTFVPPKKGPKTPKTPKHASPSPLVIHYETLGKGYDPRASIISVLPTEDSDSALRSPLSPTSANPLDFRRRRMAKLARTLGENVPPELVFRDLVQEKAQVQNDRKQLRAFRGRSWSVGSQLNSFTPIVSRKPSVMKASYESQTRSRTDSLAFNDYSTDRCLSRAESYSSEKSMSRSDTPFSQYTLDSVNTRRKHREWSGEWNTNDMDNVIKSLRDLRVK